MDRHSQGGSSASRGGSDKQPDSEILDAFLPRIEARGQRSWQPPKKGDGGAARGQSSHAGPSGQGGHGKS
jgi:hypothetical protein